MYLSHQYKDLSIRIINLIKFIKKENKLDEKKIYRPWITKSIGGLLDYECNENY